MIENKIAEERVAIIRLSFAGFSGELSKAAGAFKELIEKLKEAKELRKQLEAIATVIVKPPDTTKLLELLSRLSKEFKEMQEKIDNKNKVRKSWKYNSYSSKFNSRIADKRTIYHNCRNNC